ncbi:sulfotransferase [Dactylosporangium aurantiacum]|uniref:Sulfotransferase n=1 Tax=Dactylosporangium aurantiacum TaxID=35754 RepID=A0A9Q9IFN0_9ACTN|nr:sulfotransferase domain-containing protein [Dactylosporangium aurantiacum]MDG6102304.1 sulfotransferase domain-containing protein [Dactylosporangium aurantiacum]UWZ53390.1 sulfotransferase [Dactylosporangium aurantiacum]
MALPDLLVAGVPEAGTSALHATLVRQEPKFLLPDGPPPDRGEPGDRQTYQEHVWRREEYEALFDAAPPGTLRGEATPFYLYDRASHRRIQRLIPQAKLILLLRDPVDRAHSNWSHLWGRASGPCSTSSTAVATRPASPAWCTATAPAAWCAPARRTRRPSARTGRSRSRTSG